MGILNTEDKTAHDEAVTRKRLHDEAEARRRTKEATAQKATDEAALRAAEEELVALLIDEVRKNFRSGKEPAAKVRCSLNRSKAAHDTIAKAFHAADHYDERDKFDQLVADINAIVELHDSDFVAVCRNKHEDLMDPKDGPVASRFVAVEISLKQKSTLEPTES